MLVAFNRLFNAWKFHARKLVIGDVSGQNNTRGVAMRRRIPRIPVFLIGLTFVAPMAAADSPATQPAARTPGDKLEQQVLPDLGTGDNSGTVAQFLTMVEDKVPGFQVVMAGDPSVWETLRMPRMRLKNATVGQLVQLMRDMYPGLEVNVEEYGNSPPVYLFRINGNLNDLFHNSGMGSEAGQSLAVFGLSDAVERLEHRRSKNEAHPPERKEVLSQVLSLIKQVVAEADSVAPRLEIHEETETLLLRGTPKQVHAVNETINTLTAPSAVDKQQENEWKAEQLMQQAREKVNGMNDELIRARNERDELRRQVLTLQGREAQLRARLEEFERKYGPTTKE